MKLSILIASLDVRAEMLRHLVQRLDHIGNGIEGWEVVVDVDAGQKTIGRKRQDLLERAKGDFVVFHDDDDWPSDNYISDIMAGCRDGIDCIGFRIACYGYSRRGVHHMELADVSIRWKEWASNRGTFAYVRCPHHLVPVRRQHALKAGFDVASKYGEDAAYSFRLRDMGLLKNEHYIPDVLYTIRHNPKKKFGRA